MKSRLSPAERHVMEHAVAWGHPRPLYRNYFVAGPDHEDWPTLQSLCDRGLMRVRREPSEEFGGMTVFAVTADGQASMEEPVNQ